MGTAMRPTTAFTIGSLTAAIIGTVCVYMRRKKVRTCGVPRRRSGRLEWASADRDALVAELEVLLESMGDLALEDADAAQQESPHCV